MMIPKFHYLPKTSFLPKGPSVKFDWVVKDWFFDRDRVKNLLDVETRLVFQRFGRETMYDAKKSMPWRKGPSAPGQPPHAHKYRNRIRLTNNIKRGPFSVHYSFDPQRRGVIIGPEKFPNEIGDLFIPATLEHGGRTTTSNRAVNPRRKYRRIGDSGLIRFVDQMPRKPRKPRAPRPPKQGATQARQQRYRVAMAKYELRMTRYRNDIADWERSKGQIRKLKGVDGKTYLGIFAKLKTQKMAHRAMRLEGIVWGPFKIKMGAIAPRPYMRPAFIRQQRRLPRFWADASARMDQQYRYLDRR